MIAETALALAGPSAVLVSRPTGVAHVYVGPLTPAAAVPPRRRPVCRVRSKRLTSLPERRTSLDPSARRLCARCSACLSRTRNRDRQAGPTCTHRDDYRRVYADLTVRDLWAQALMAETPEEITAVGHLSLLVAGHRTCQEPFPFVGKDVTGTYLERLARIHRGAGVGHTRNLTELVGVLREHLAGYPNRGRGELLNEYVAAGYEQARADRKANREERLARAGVKTKPH